MRFSAGAISTPLFNLITGTMTLTRPSPGLAGQLLHHAELAVTWATSGKANIYLGRILLASHQANL
jgi:hypothetical protein